MLKLPEVSPTFNLRPSAQRRWVGLKLSGLSTLEFASRLRRVAAAAHVNARAGLPKHPTSSSFWARKSEKLRAFYFAVSLNFSFCCHGLFFRVCSNIQNRRNWSVKLLSFLSNLSCDSVCVCGCCWWPCCTSSVVAQSHLHIWVFVEEEV